MTTVYIGNKEYDFDTMKNALLFVSRINKYGSFETVIVSKG